MPGKSKNGKLKHNFTTLLVHILKPVSNESNILEFEILQNVYLCRQEILALHQRWRGEELVKIRFYILDFLKHNIQL